MINKLSRPFLNANFSTKEEPIKELTMLNVVGAQQTTHTKFELPIIETANIK